MTPVTHIKNIGPASAKWLHDIGVFSKEDIEALGVIEVFRALRAQKPNISMNMLWALAAGMQGRDWRELTVKEKTLLCKHINI